VPRTPVTSGTSFETFPLSTEVQAGIRACGYREPTEVQACCIEPLLAGRDLVVQSRTGTGKTAAFGIPLVERVAPERGAAQALILTPTRELASQVADELTRLGARRRIPVLKIYGGVGYGPQIDGLKAGNPIVVGTPGRLLDHIGKGTLRLDRLLALVLDEADEMLSRGFLPDIMRIIDACPKSRQTLLFSATIPKEIERIAKRHMQDPVRVELSGDQVGVAEIENRLYRVDPESSRPRQLLALLEAERPDSAIIFCNTRSDTELVTQYLGRRGYDAALINSDLSQAARETVLGRVKRGELTYMVATDIAARGIDISDLPYVIHYTLPFDAHVYIHRSGRTGRIGKKGVAAALYSDRDLREVFTRRSLENEFKVEFEERTPPSREETLAMVADRRLEELKSKADAVISEEHQAVARAILDDAEAERLVGCLLQEADAVRLKRAAGPTPKDDRPRRRPQDKPGRGRRSRKRR